MNRLQTGAASPPPSKGGGAPSTRETCQSTNNNNGQQAFFLWMSKYRIPVCVHFSEHRLLLQAHHHPEFALNISGVIVVTPPF